MNNRDYVFYLNWDDKDKNTFKVGYLAQIEEEFYFVIRSREKEKTENSAYDKGFIGIPGFRAGEIYKSKELFDFFKNRILNKYSKTPCKELAETKGKSMIDSFYLEEIEEFEKQKRLLLEAYEKQEESKKNKDNKSEKIMVL